MDLALIGRLNRESQNALGVHQIGGADLVVWRRLMAEAAVALNAAGKALAFAHLHHANGTRALRWHKGPQGILEWSTFEWAGAMGGEAGEALNAAKKMKRLECKMQQHGGDSGTPKDMEEAVKKLLKEVGDTVVYADLVCQRVGRTLEEAVRMAFNQVSERENFPERLP